MWSAQAKSNRLVYEREKVKVSVFDFLKYWCNIIGPCNAHWATKADQAHDSDHKAQKANSSEN